ncbi:hypothetical protein HYQ46_002613 [Verticillium longisporum]|nr:hypothetical protein HYQ46_002613 [Verticillium longisporum]
MGWAWETREGRGRGCVGDNKPDASAVSGGTGLQVHSMGADLRASFECKSRGQTQGTISDKGAPTTPLHAGRHRQGISVRTDTYRHLYRTKSQVLQGDAPRHPAGIPCNDLQKYLFQPSPTPVTDVGHLGNKCTGSSGAHLTSNAPQSRHSHALPSAASPAPSSHPSCAARSLPPAGAEACTAVIDKNTGSTCGFRHAAVYPPKEGIENLAWF